MSSSIRLLTALIDEAPRGVAISRAERAVQSDTRHNTSKLLGDVQLKFVSHPEHKKRLSLGTYFLCRVRSTLISFVHSKPIPAHNHYRLGARSGLISVLDLSVRNRVIEQ